jgi:hypothetical protein
MVSALQIVWNEENCGNLGYLPGLDYVKWLSAADRVVI